MIIMNTNKVSIIDGYFINKEMEEKPAQNQLIDLH